MKLKILAGGVFAVLVLTMSACSGSGNAVRDECLESIARHVGEPVSDLIVKETIVTPGGSADWRGTYSGGEWACGGDRDQLYQAVVYPTGGIAESVDLAG